MKLIDNILFIEFSEVVKSDKNPSGFIPKGTFDTWKQRGKINVIGRGGNGNEVLIEFESLPTIYQALVQEKLCNGSDPYQYAAKQPLRDMVKPDIEARKFFETYELPNGDQLSDEYKLHWSNGAAILNAFAALLADKRKLKKDWNISIGDFWKLACELVKDAYIMRRFPHSLPSSERHLKPRFNAYKKEGYAALIDGRIFNETNNKKVDDRLEWLILSLYASKDRPYIKEAFMDYQQFMNGKMDLMDKRTGELFNPSEYEMVSDTTFWRYVNDPKNVPVIAAIRKNALDNSNTNLPYNLRHAPKYSLSKITMDDLSLPFKMHDGKRVWAYEVADVCSKAIIGRAYAISNDEGSGKDRELFLNAMRDMFANIQQHGWGVPAEVEVEHHIANTFTDDLLKEGLIFQYVTFCRPANPRQKRMEHVFRMKKYGFQRKEKGFQGRPFGRLDANKFNESDHQRYSFDDIVAMENANIEAFNHALHDNQSLYPGMSRWQVLESHINPQLLDINNNTLARIIGKHTATTLKANKYVRVQYQDYYLPNPAILKRLQNYQFTAYYLPGDNIKEVHLYQDDRFVCTAPLQLRYNESKAERTEADNKIMHQQFGYRSAYDAMVRKGKEELAKIEKFNTETVDKAINKPSPMPKVKPVKAKKPEPVTEIITKDWAAMAEDDL